MFALVLSGMVLILVYVFVAKDVFEKDKISYVFDTQNSRLSVIKREMNAKFERGLLAARAVIATTDLTIGKTSTLGKEVFESEDLLLALDIYDESNSSVIWKIEKQPELSRGSFFQADHLRAGDVTVRLSANNQYILSFKPFSGEQQSLIARVLIDSSLFLPKGETRQPLLVLKDKKSIFTQDAEGFEQKIIDSLVLKFSDEQRAITRIEKIEGSKYLVSVAKLNFGDIQVLAFFPEKEALGALQILFLRSVVFVVFSLFGLVIISLLFAKGLTSNLQTLTNSAKQIGQGQFEGLPHVKSQDEIGILSKAFLKMSSEIQRLLGETRDKARMEAELKTARLVQDSLMPRQPTIAFRDIEVSGRIQTSSECGGDWWYYFSRGDDLYVAIADATGHGTPAALITAAARSVFSKIERSELSLVQMMQDWDIAVSSSSNKKVFMTGILLKINTVNGEINYLGAGHEAPYRFAPFESGLVAETLDLDVHSSIGEGWPTDLSAIREQKIVLNPGESLVLYTDGIYSVERPQGPKLSEKRFLKMLVERLAIASSAEQVTNGVFQCFDDYRQSLDLPDDVTVVSLYRRGQKRQVGLANEAGDLSYDKK